MNTELSARDIALFQKQYLETALWAECPEEESWESARFSCELLEKTLSDCTRFLDLAYDLIESDAKNGGNLTQAAHDFLLTRNGHGAGFWDGDWENGEELTRIANQFGEIWFYLGDDGLLYCTGGK